MKRQAEDDVRVQVKIRKENANVMDPESINHLENLGGGDLGGKEPKKRSDNLDDVKIDKIN